MRQAGEYELDAERLAEIVDNMSDAFVAIDHDWRFTYVNSKALLSLGADREKVIGRSAFDVFPQFTGGEIERNARRAMEEDVPVAFDSYHAPDRSWTEVRIYPAPDGIALYYRDITARKRAADALQRRAAVIDGINEILRAALSVADERDLGIVCLEVAERVTGSQFGFISELGADGLLHDVAISNPGWTACARLGEQHSRLREPMRVAGIHGRVIREGRPVFTNDPRAEPDGVGLPTGHPPLESFLGVPLTVNGGPFGLVAVANREGGYNAEVAELLEVLAPAIVEALDRFRSEQRERSRAQFDRALNEVSEAAHSTLDDTTILERAVRDVSRVTGLNAIAIHVRENQQWAFSYSYGLPPELREMRLSDAQAPMSLGVLQSGEPLVMNDAFSDPRSNKALVERFAIRSLIGLPLTVRGEPFGVLFAGNIGERTSIGEDVVEFLKRIAATLSLALDNARLYEGEHRVAETLQQALLSLPARVEGVTFAHAYRSATEAALVGGDFYDIFELEHDRIGVVIGDVAGKGLQAAALTSLLKNTIRAHASEHDNTVADVLSMTSDLVFRVTEPETFATVFLAFVDCGSGRLIYCNGGHTTAAIVDREGRMRHLRANSPLIGALAKGDFVSDEDELCAEEFLLLYTDGIIEARSASSELYGERRLFEVVSQAMTATPDEVVDAVMADVSRFTGGQLSDDVALMVVALNRQTVAGAGPRAAVGGRQP